MTENIATAEARNAARDAYSADYIEANRLQYNDVDEQNDGDGVGYWYVEIDRQVVVEGKNAIGCACGCGLAVRSAKRNFLPGHDQRLMGILVRAHREGMEVATPMGGVTISSDPMGYGQTVLGDTGVAKLAGYIANEPKRTRRPRTTAAQAAEILDPTPAAPVMIGTCDVKVGRWTYPGREMSDGSVVRNSKRDGSGEWVAVND